MDCIFGVVLVKNLEEMALDELSRGLNEDGFGIPWIWIMAC